ncbi:MAG: AAA family ATPase [Burkholderiaceae bacterium]|nr:AAA family ATPase [Burkholderiaceae bacterium]
MVRARIKVFVSYSHLDEAYMRRDSLYGFLHGLRNTGIEFWTDRDIDQGADWDKAIREQLAAADVALLLVSQAFLDSDYIAKVEIRSLLERPRPELALLPVLLSPCDWMAQPWLARLQFLPRDGKTVEEDFGEPGPFKRLCLQIRSELARLADAACARNAARAAPPTAERRHVATASCELRPAAAGLEPDEALEVVLAAMPAFERLAGQVAERFDGHLETTSQGVRLHFGYPRAHEHDARQAVLALQELATKLGRLPGTNGDRVVLRAGIDYGIVMATPEGRLSGTSIDEADRLRAAAGPGEMLASARMVPLLAPHFELSTAVDRPGCRVGAPSLGQGRADDVLLLGRDAELAVLRSAWDRARDGRGGLVLLRGDRGMGKSRLLQGLRQVAGGPAWRDIRLKCSPLHTNDSLHPVLDHLRRRLQMRDDQVPDMAALAAALTRDGLDEAVAVPALAPLFGDAQAASSPAAIRRDLLEALATWVLAVADREPVLLSLEDAQWADPSTLEWFTTLTDYLDGSRILAVASSSEPFAEALHRVGGVCEIHLDRFGPEVAAELVARLDPQRRIPASSLPAIMVATDGIPLFVEEYVKMLLDGSGAEEAVPGRLSGLLEQRLDSLGSAKPCAELAAVIGFEFDPALLFEVARKAGIEAPEAGLARMLELGVARRSGRPGHDRHAFRHGLMRDVAYHRLPSRERRRYHALVAASLAAQAPCANPALVAHHLTRGNDKALAIPCWRQSARRDMARSAGWEARHDLDQALQLVPALPEAEQAAVELSLRLDYGAVLVAVSGYAAAETAQTYERARLLSRQVGDSSQRVAALFGAWAYAIVRAEFDGARQLAAELDQVADAGAEPASRIEAHHAVAITHFNQGRFHEALARLDSGLALCAEAGCEGHAEVYGQDPVVAMGCWRALCLSYLGDFAAAQAQWRAARERADSQRQGLDRIFACTFGGIVNDAQGRFEAAAQLAGIAANLAEEQAFPYWRAWADFVAANAAWEQDHGGRSLERMAAAIAAYAATGARVWLPFMQLRLAAGHALAGDLARAGEAARQGREAGSGSRETYYAAEVLALEARVSAAAGDEARALSRLDEAWAIATAQSHRVAAAAIVATARALGDAAALQRCEQWQAVLAAAAVGAPGRPECRPSRRGPAQKDPNV